MKSKLWLLLSMLMVGAMVLAACGTPATEQPAAEEPAAEEPAAEEPAAEEPAAEAGFLACQVTDVGGIDDKSFNATAWKGVQDAIDQLGIDGKFLESQEQADYEKNINAFVEEGCDVIVTVGFLLGDATAAGAQANPDIPFTIVDFAYDPTIPNVVGQVFNTDEAAFLAGYVAAGVTQTGIVGTFGGIPIPPVTIFMDGFFYGVQHYNNVNGTDVKVLGWDPAAPDSGLFAGNFESTDDGRRLGESLMDEGADIIMPVAGPVGLGTAAAAQERGGVYIIGVDADWVLTNEQYADIILTSVLKNMDVTTLNVIKSVMDGSFEGGVTVGTLENGGVGLAPFHNMEGMVGDALQAEVDDVRNAIISGELSASGGGAAAPAAEEPSTIVIGTTDEISGLDAGTVYAVHDWELLRNINQSLLRWEPGTANLAPGIADFPEVSDDGKTYTFTLRDGVAFCDGTELTAQMYVDQFSRTINIPDSESGGALVAPYVESVEADGNNVVFTLTDSFGFFSSVVTGAPYMPTNPATFGPDEFNDFPEASADAPLCGVGPWMITSYDPAEQTVLEPNPFYFGDDQPKVDRVIVRYFADPQTMALAVQEGEIDVAWRILGPDLRAQLADVDGLTTTRINGGPIRYFIVNHGIPPFDDPNVHQAVAALIDRDEISDRVFAGQVVPLYSPIPPGYIGADETLYDDVYQAPNVDKARELLSASGYSESNPVEIDLWYPPEHYGGVVADAVQVLKEQIEASGMATVNLNAQDWATYVGAVIGGTDYPISFLGWFFDYPDSDNWVSPFGLGAGLGSNTNNDELDALLLAAAAESDADARAALYGQVQDLWAQLNPTIPLWIEPEYVEYWTDRVSGVNIGPTIEFNYNQLSLNN